jgi:hypothetical protein
MGVGYRRLWCLVFRGSGRHGPLGFDGETLRVFLGAACQSK